jgi:hypothetical protein
MRTTIRHIAAAAARSLNRMHRQRLSSRLVKWESSSRGLVGEPTRFPKRHPSQSPPRNRSNSPKWRRFAGPDPAVASVAEDHHEPSLAATIIALRQRRDSALSW